LNKQFTLADLLRQSVYSRLAGYEDLNDAERLAADPTFRLIVGALVSHPREVGDEEKNR
jgi:Transposase DDE domain group 1